MNSPLAWLHRALVAGRAVPRRLSLLALAAAPAIAGAADRPTGADSCVDVEVNGYRAFSYSCLSRQMTPPGPARPEAATLASERIANRPPNQLGLANRAATANRMGNHFGKSAYPQRPPTRDFASPLPQR